MESDKPGVPLAHPANAITSEDLKTVKTLVAEDPRMYGIRLHMSAMANLVRVFKEIAERVGGLDKLAQCFDTLVDLRD